MQEVEQNLATVRALLGAAGLNPPPEEVERLGELYGPIRRQLAMIHAADVGDADPSNVFRAAQTGSSVPRSSQPEDETGAGR